MCYISPFNWEACECLPGIHAWGVNFYIWTFFHLSIFCYSVIEISFNTSQIVPLS